MEKFGYLRRNGFELIACQQSTISYPLHNHISVFTLGFVLDGAAELIMGRGSKVYQRNDVFVIPPYTPHCINAKSCYTLLSLCISSDIITDFKLEESKPDIAVFLHDAIHQPLIEARMIRTVCSLAFISQMMPVRKENAVNRLRMRLEMYPERKYSVDDMAKAAFISKYNLIRTFKQEVGLTPHQFQIQNRIRKAKKLLEESAPITEVALATGFYDQSHFIRHFEKIVGLTPTGYKQACKMGIPLFTD